MPLFCRGCSDAIDKDIQNSLDEFPRTKKSNIFETLIAEGMERFCNACRRSGRLKNLPDNVPDDHTMGSEDDNIDAGEQSFLQCQQCKGVLKRASFDPEKLQTWTKNRHISTQAKCLVCEAKEDTLKCMSCEQEKSRSEYDLQKFSAWKKNRHLGRSAKCLVCEEEIKCVRCEKVKNRSEYDPVMLQRWKKNRDLAKKAECKSCAAARGMKTHEPKRNWLQTTYKCSKCGTEYPPKHFAYATLASLEADKQTFLAVCLHCNPVIYETHASLKPVTCVACKKLKERKEFTIERQRCSTLATRYEVIHADDIGD